MAAINVNSRQSKSKIESKLSDQRYVIFGAGSAGMGIAVQIRDAMVTADGISREEANFKFWAVDKEGLLYERDVGTKNADQYRAEFIRSAGEEWGSSGSVRDVGLLEVVERVKPTILIGCSTAPGTFTKEVVEAMTRGLEEDVRPIIMPLSNPSRLVEAKPVDLLNWTNGRALVATGSPFGTVKLNIGGEEKEFVIAECNNALIYPGIGFGAILSQSRRVTDTMLIEGAKRLASLSPAIQANSKNVEEYEYNGDALLPDFGIAPGVNFEIGIAVAEQAVREGTAGESCLAGGGGDAAGAVEQIRMKAKENVWVPVYPDYVYDEQGVE